MKPSCEPSPLGDYITLISASFFFIGSFAKVRQSYLYHSNTLHKRPSNHQLLLSHFVPIISCQDLSKNGLLSEGVMLIQVSILAFGKFTSFSNHSSLSCSSAGKCF